MKSAVVFLSSIAMLLSVAACTSRTALESQDSLRATGTARMHFIRPETIVSAGQPARIRVNEKEVGSLGIGTYLHIDRPAGQYLLVVDHPLDFGKTELTVNVGQGKDYYFKVFPGAVNVAFAGGYGTVSHKLGIVSVDEAEAKALMREMKN